MKIIFDFTQEKFTLPQDVLGFLQNSKSNFIEANTLIPFKEKEKISFNLNLVRTAKNQWHIINEHKKGKGSFGTVNSSSNKIMLYSSKRQINCELIKVNDVVKIQKIENINKIQKIENINNKKNLLEETRKNLLEETRKEANFQQRQGVEIIAVVEEKDKIITVIEDCGTSLDQLFPLGTNYDFDKRVMIAIGIINEMITLAQQNVVHRDLKTANICLKKLENGSFQLIFIDFGLAEKTESSKNADESGTPLYMAPELFTGGKTTSKSDIFALSLILAQVFSTGSNVFKNKNQTYQKFYKQDDAYYKMAIADLCFDDLLKGYKIDGVDPVLMKDIQNFLVLLHSKTADQRPSLPCILKFFSLIPTRKAAYEKFNKDFATLENKLKELEGFYSRYKVIKNRHKGSLNKDQKNNLILSKATSVFAQPFIPKQNSIYKEINAITPLKAAKSHIALAQTLVNKNRMADMEGEDQPFTNLEPIIQSISDEVANFKKIEENFNNQKAKICSAKFQGSNSSGIKEIIQILNSSWWSPIEKLEKLQAIGKDKTKSGFRNWYSHSHLFFGKGRHTNIDVLYNKFAALGVTQDKNQYLAAQKLDDIIAFIANNDFVHKEKTTLKM